MSGNVKLACTLLDYNKIKEDTFETNIRGAHLLPLSSSLFQKSVTANLLNSSWEYDLKKFYTAYSDIFYDTVFPISVLEMPILDETQIFKNRNLVQFERVLLKTFGDFLQTLHGLFVGQFLFGHI